MGIHSDELRYTAQRVCIVLRVVDGHGNGSPAAEALELGDGTSGGGYCCGSAPAEAVSAEGARRQTKTKAKLLCPFQTGTVGDWPGGLGCCGGRAARSGRHEEGGRHGLNLPEVALGKSYRAI